MKRRPDEIAAAWLARLEKETAEEIAQSEGITRNAVIGAVDRYKRRYLDRAPQPVPPTPSMSPGVNGAALWDRILDGESAIQIAANLGITTDDVALAIAAYRRKVRPKPAREIPAPRKPILRIVGTAKSAAGPPAESLIPPRPPQRFSAPPDSFAEAVDRQACLFMADGDRHPTCLEPRRGGSRYCAAHHCRCTRTVKWP